MRQVKCNWRTSEEWMSESINETLPARLSLAINSIKTIHFIHLFFFSFIAALRGPLVLIYFN